MNIKEFYASFDPTGEEYENVMGRLATERLVSKYLKKMIEDKSFDSLQKAVAAGDYKEAFMASHTIKGICMNLNLKPLAQSSDVLTEELRNTPDVGRVQELLRKVEEDYKFVTDGIKNID